MAARESVGRLHEKSKCKPCQRDIAKKSKCSLGKDCYAEGLEKSFNSTRKGVVCSFLDCSDKVDPECCKRYVYMIDR